jgi:hypothetical protein
LLSAGKPPPEAELAENGENEKGKCPESGNSGFNTRVTGWADAKDPFIIGRQFSVRQFSGTDTICPEHVNKSTQNLLITD